MKRRFSGLFSLGLVVFTILLFAPTIAQADFWGDVNQRFNSTLASGNYVLALVLVYLIGLSTALTPCVYPMIAITVSIFGARQAKSRRESMMLSTAFVLGIATLFTPLGVIAGYTGGLFGAWLASPVVLIVFAVMFFALALSMFGAFELNLPPALQNRLAEVGGVGVRGAFAMGMVSALIAAPCTGPGFLALLSWIGTTRNIGFGAAATFVYALGLGTLFWFVGAFAVNLPKSGRWMDATKSIFGIVMCVMALYYVRDLLGVTRFFEHNTMLWASGLVLLILGIALGAIHLDFHEKNVPHRIRKAVGIVLATLGGFAVVLWMVIAPPGLHWREDFAAAMANARAEHKPYIVDFGASWCGACGELERNTFVDAEVMREGARFVAVHIDLSPGLVTPEKNALLRSYNQRGLPLVVMHDHNGNEIHRVTEFMEAEPFVQLMQSVH